MALWIPWYNALLMLRPAFSYYATFLWFMLCIAGLSVRSDNLGVTCIVRALSLKESRYYNLLRCFHSPAIKLPQLSQIWAQTVLTLFGDRIERVNGRIVLLADGKHMAKAGKKMPGVKFLRQTSESNTKPSHIMCHSAQCVSVLARAANTLFSVPLDMKIHEGLVFSNRDKRTLLDKLLIMIGGLNLNDSFFLVADAYYGSGKMIKVLLKQDNHLITRAKSSFVAYHRAHKRCAKPKRGRPAFYGKKVKLTDLFRSALAVQTIVSPVYGRKVSRSEYAPVICCGSLPGVWCDLYWLSIPLEVAWCSCVLIWRWSRVKSSDSTGCVSKLNSASNRPPMSLAHMTIISGSGRAGG